MGGNNTQRREKVQKSGSTDKIMERREVKTSINFRNVHTMFMFKK